MQERSILMDIQVQGDLFLPTGSLYVRGGARATANIVRLFHWARTTGVPVVSSALLVRRHERGPFGRIAHCVEGSEGAMKLPRTLLPRRVNLGLAHTADLPRDLLRQVQQVLFETRDPDIFRHQKFERLVTELPKDYTFVLCGATVALGVKQAVLGLRRRGFDVVLAEDAMVDLGHPRTEMAWLQIVAKGARPLPTAQIVREFVPSRPRRRVAQKAAAR